MKYTPLGATDIRPIREAARHMRAAGREPIGMKLPPPPDWVHPWNPEVVCKWLSPHGPAVAITDERMVISYDTIHAWHSRSEQAAVVSTHQLIHHEIVSAIMQMHCILLGMPHCYAMRCCMFWPETTADIAPAMLCKKCKGRVVATEVSR